MHIFYHITVWINFNVVRYKMATPVGVGVLSFEDVLELSVEQLKVELEGRYIESKGLSKPQMQKALIVSLSLEALVVTQEPVVTQQPSPLTEASELQQPHKNYFNIRNRQCYVLNTNSHHL